MDTNNNMTDSQIMNYIFQMSQKKSDLELEDVFFDNSNSITDHEIMAHFADVEAENNFFENLVKVAPRDEIEYVEGKPCYWPF